VKVDKASVTFGKKKEEVDVVLDDVSVSRMHARILRDGEKVLLEDLNSTNGTFKNGLRMEPYERRELEVGDEIRIGTQELMYR
jgi:pSer/pThr/pTyr-binding forkhead associated (FHA) protein